ncbi:LysR family transcriptional regulator [Azoarcus sp. DN11]|uniref:LysR family transcriptional regulator n=1 Tax=Azoarcus sp. DN11 TaxID=356837 RepID=UPI000EABCDA3|nr:LysR family transcriptional regulator [Azoarcus sp. DN11]AYH43822.1 LysR family transcriptional regulator [Azoarcus sp. DN11]
MPINEMRAISTFTKAVELGSLRKAAAALGVSPQAASQAVAQLEQHLGVRLLHRTTRHIALTDEGQQFLESAQPAMAMLERALQRVTVAKDEIAGPLRIIAPRSSFATLLWPVINAFCEEYPDVQPDLHLDDQIANWVEERADVGFRIGAPPEEGLIARKLFVVSLVICAAPKYLERHGIPKTLDELSDHRCSMFRRPVTGQVYPWFLKVGDELVQREFPPALSTNDTETELQAVLDGRVIGQLAAFSAVPHLRAGRLVPVLTQHMTDHMSVHLFYGSRRAQPARVRKFIDFAVERLTDSPDYVLNEREIREMTGRTRFPPS